MSMAAEKALIIGMVEAEISGVGGPSSDEIRLGTVRSTRLAPKGQSD
jgi:hypothetical protein